ncbi:MAG: transporter [Maricaulis sp.]|jgi:CzcA family heavy metal efflux pump|nr:transporter [Maricaulis sp.]
MSHQWISRQSRFLLAGFLVLAVAGGFFLMRLPVSLFPAIEFPRIAVSLEAGDMPVDMMVNQVTRPSEEALRAIPGVRNIRSQTSRGSAEISLSFDWGTDMVTAALQANTELARISPALPAGMRFDVRRMDPTIFPVLGYSITSDSESLVSLRNFATYQLRPLLASIDGVAEVSVLGGRNAEYQVLVDPVRLRAHGLSLSDVETALTLDNIVVAAGRLEDRSRLFLTILDNREVDIESIGSTIVATGDGTIVEIDDVADIRLSTAQEWTRVSADGHPAVLINIRQSPTANSLALTDAVKRALEQESANFPPGLTITPYYDQSELVRAAASSVRDSILIGTLLAGFVLFAFLRSWRFVLVVAILLPSVLAATAILLTALGLSLNIMSLGGMAAAVGLVVDDIVVMLEHITRRLAERTMSVMEAAGEMFRPLIGSSLATVIVFTPLAFLSGVTGGFFKALAVTMAACLIFSMIFTLAICPLLARWFAKAQDAERADSGNRWLGHVATRYSRAMDRILTAPRIAMAVIVILAVIVGGFATTRLASGFMPQMDEGGFVLDYVAPPGLSLTETDRLVTQLETIIRSIPEVSSYSRRTGLQLGGGLTEANEGDMFVHLTPLPRRPIDAVMSDIRQRVENEVPGLTIETIQLMGDVIGDLTAVPQPIEIKFYGTDPLALAEAASRAEQAMQGVRGVVEIQKSDRVSGDAIEIVLDRAHLGLEGLTPQAVADQLDGLVGGRVASQIQDGVRTIDVRVWTDETARDRVEAIGALMLRSSDGHLLPLSRVAQIRIASGQTQTSRENLQLMTAVTGRLEGRDMGSAMRDIRAVMQTVSLPSGVRYAFGGLYAEQQKSFRDLIVVFLSALVLSALLLVFLFRDFSKAASILLVVGVSVSGVMAGLALTGTELNIASMMGLTMVIGIIAELGVFYFAELPEGRIEMQHRIEAGLARIRPIFMSALIAILALAPLALKIGQGSALLAPMAVAIIAGLIVGAPMVLIGAPVFHGALAIRRESPRDEAKA